MKILLTAIRGLWDNRTVRYIIIVLFVIFIGFLSLHLYGNSRYKDGAEEQKAVYEKEQATLKEEYQKRLDAANIDRINLNSEIAEQKRQYQELKNKRQDKSNQVEQKVNDYAKSNNGSKLCLDPEWLRLYQDSLPQ